MIVDSTELPDDPRDWSEAALKLCIDDQIDRAEQRPEAHIELAYQAVSSEVLDGRPGLAQALQWTLFEAWEALSTIRSNQKAVRALVRHGSAKYREHDAWRATMAAAVETGEEPPRSPTACEFDAVRAALAAVGAERTDEKIEALSAKFVQQSVVLLVPAWDCAILGSAKYKICYRAGLGLASRLEDFVCAAACFNIARGWRPAQLKLGTTWGTDYHQDTDERGCVWG